MTYAHRKDIYDADTHMMERPDRIVEFADKEIKNQLEPFVEGHKETLTRVDKAISNFKERNSSETVLNTAKEEFMGWNHKGWEG